MRTYATFLLVLLLPSPIPAAELKLSGELYVDYLEVTLQNSADHDVSFLFKAQVKQRTGGDWKLIETLRCSVNSSVPTLGQDSLNCSYTTPLKDGEYKIYARANILNGTYTYKDFLFNVTDGMIDLPEIKYSPPQQRNITSPKKAISVTILQAPEKVKTGEEFIVQVNLTSYKNTTLEIYSYVYSGKTCYSFLGWKGNAEKFDFLAGESRIINLTDTVGHAAVNGTYSLKVRARENIGSSFKDYDSVKPITVELVPVDMFKEIRTDDKKTDSKDDKDDSLPLGLLLPLLGSLPLFALLVKKIL